MAFPVIADSNNSIEGSDTSTHTVSLPANISAGDLLIVLFSNDGDDTVSFPAGWTQLFSDTYSVYTRFSAAYRKADGNEGASISVTTSGSERSAHISYRITGAADPDTQAPEVSTSNSDRTDSPDPNSLTPTGGAKDYLWIACVGSDDLDLATGYPTNYSNGETYRATTSSGGSVVSAAKRNLNASSENPGTFTLANSEEWVAYTIAVHPSAAAGGGVENTWINIGDTFKKLSEMYVNIGDTWKEISELYINVGDVWEKSF